MRFNFTNKKTNEVLDLSIDGNLDAMINRIVDRIKKYNNEGFLIITGDTGTGKTTLASTICARASTLLERDYDNSSIYFDSDKMVKDAINTKEKIYHYDEALFSSMATDWQTKAQKNLIKMLLLCRKKKHFFVFCIPDFFKLKDTIAVEKSIGLIRTYLRDGIRPGAFTYYKKKSKDTLYTRYKRKGIKDYKMFISYRGTFANDFGNIVDENTYDKMKDTAILTISPEVTTAEEDKAKKYLEKDILMFKMVDAMNFPIKDLAKELGISVRGVYKRRKMVKDALMVKERAIKEGLALATLS